MSGINYCNGGGREIAAKTITHIKKSYEATENKCPRETDFINID